MHAKRELQKLKEQFFEKDSAAIAEEIARLAGSHRGAD